MIFEQKVGIITYHEIKKRSKGEGFDSRVAPEDARFQGRDTRRYGHEHDRRGIEAHDVHRQGGRQNALPVCSSAPSAGGGAAQCELAGGEVDSQGNERRLQRGDVRAHERFTEGIRILDRDRPGQRPKENPEGEEIFEEVVSFLSGYRELFNPTFKSIRKNRSADKILYEGNTFVWTVLLGAFLRHGSRNQMDVRRNDERYALSVLKLAGQDWWVRDSEFTTPCSESCCNYLKRGCTPAIERALVDQVRYLIKGKYFDCAKLRGNIVIALDGSKHEKIRACTWGNGRNLRFVLEAKIITPWGWAISVMSEPIRPYSTDEEKQDCEYKGFVRLAKRIMDTFPRLGICIVGDALYACSPVIKICEQYNWDYIFTFKQGRTPAAYKEAETLMDICPGNSGRIVCHNQHGKPYDGGSVAWASNVEIAGLTDDPVVFNVVKVCAADTEGSQETTYEGCFATSLDIKNAENAAEIARWGRQRWNIENNFKVEKNDGFGLEHNFCNKARASRNFYLLMQLANNLWQVFNLGHLYRLQKRHRKVSQKEWVAIIRECFHRIGIVSFTHVPRRYLSRELMM